MIPGFNHNIKHKGRLFHIQTEDSGPKNPHTITHLFVGGNVLASKKQQYAEIIGNPDYEKTVRSMMEEQHKQMLRDLIHGVFDSIESAPSYQLDGPAPINFTAVSPATSSMAGGHAFKGIPGRAKPAAVDFPRVGGEIATTAASPPPRPREMLRTPSEVIAAVAPTAPTASQPTHVHGVPSPGEKSLTIFGEDLISEKSLDEVILSYLAEDLADLE